MELLGTSGEALGSYEEPLELLGPLGNFWEPLELLGASGEALGSSGEPLELLGASGEIWGALGSL